MLPFNLSFLNWEVRGVETTVIIDIVTIFLSALIGGIIAERLKQSPIIGYILGGIMVGPFVLGLVSDLHLINDFAEIGIILLMFTLGIEFSPSRLEKVKEVALIGGSVQVLAMIAIGTATGKLLGLSWYEAFFLGCVVSISSTMIVLRVLGDQGELNSTHGQVMLGILIFQDLAVIIMVSLLPNLADFSGDAVSGLILSLGKSVVFVLALLYLAQKVVPAFLDRAARGSNNDIFLILALILGMGIALLAHVVGLSVSLGAFLGGLVISESEYAHEIMGKIITLRDAFVIVFFVSVGMLIDPHNLFQDWIALLAILAVIICGKLLVFFITTRWFYHSRVAFYVGMGMMQTGEFSFVLAIMGLEQHLIPANLYNLILASSLISIVFTPLFIGNAPYVYNRLQKIQAVQFLFPPARFEDSEVDVNSLKDHIIVCGYGRVGRGIVEALQQLELPFVVIDFDYQSVNYASRQGISYIYGDAANDIVTTHARPDLARMAVLTLPDVYTNRQTIRNMLKMNPDLIILARAHSEWEKKFLLDMGAYDVVQPEKAAGTLMARYLIQHLELPREAVEKYLESLYIRDYHHLVHQTNYESFQKKALKVREYLVGQGSPFANKSLMDTRIRELTGCSVVTIKTGDGELTINPSSDEFIKEGTSVIVMGTVDQLLEFSRVNGGGSLPDRDDAGRRSRLD